MAPSLPPTRRTAPALPADAQCMQSCAGEGVRRKLLVRVLVLDSLSSPHDALLLPCPQTRSVCSPVKREACLLDRLRELCVSSKPTPISQPFCTLSNAKQSHSHQECAADRLVMLGTAAGRAQPPELPATRVPAHRDAHIHTNEQASTQSQQSRCEGMLILASIKIALSASFNFQLTRPIG